MPHQRTVYAAALGLALVSLVVDRLFLGGASGPADAAASTSAAPGAPGSATAATAAVAPVAASLDAGEMLADRLDLIARSHALLLDDVHDAFRAAPDWYPPQRAAQGTTDNTAPATVETFPIRHRLMAVLQGDGGVDRAIVDGRPVRVGQIVDGFRLLNVTTRSALFERDGQTVELQIAEPAVPGAAPQ